MSYCRNVIFATEPILDYFIKHPVAEYSKTKKIVIVVILFVLFYSIIFFINFIVGPKLAQQATVSFFEGLQLIGWISYY